MNILNDIVATLDKGFSTPTSNLSKFLKKHRTIKKWIIASDYCFDDKNKKNDVIAISLIPYVMDFSQLKSIVFKLARRDIKHTKIVDDKFIDFLRYEDLFNISVIVKQFDLFKNREEIKNFLVGFEHALINVKDCNDYIQSLIKKVLLLKNETSQQNFNVKLMRRILLTSILTSYFIVKIIDQCNADLIAWFSDRDSMTTSNKKFIYDLLWAMTKTLCHLCGEKNKPLGNNLKLCHAEQTNENLWMDEIIRIPDYIAGTFADYDYMNNTCGDKFVSMIEKFAAGNSYFHCFEFGIMKKKTKFTISH